MNSDPSFALKIVLIGLGIPAVVTTFFLVAMRAWNRGARTDKPPRGYPYGPGYAAAPGPRQQTQYRERGTPPED